MQTIQLREKVGDDGILHLDVPLDSGRGEVEVIIVVQPVTTEADQNTFPTKIVDGEKFRFEEGEWVHDSWPVGFGRRFYGIFADDPLERPEQLHLEEREPFE